MVTFNHQAGYLAQAEEGLLSNSGICAVSPWLRRAHFYGFNYDYLEYKALIL